MRIFAIILFCFQLLNSTYAQDIINNTLILKDANYLDLQAGKFKKASILIKNGEIIEIGNIGNSVIGNLVTIDAKDKWVIPGLVDAHIHLFQSGGLYTRPDGLNLTEFQSYESERQWLKDNAEDLLKRYLRCGITTLIDVGGPIYNFELRDKFNDNKLYPNLLLTGPLLSTYQPKVFDIDETPIVKINSKEEAIDWVQKQLPYKPDFIKIWYIVLPDQTAASTYEIVETIINESHNNKLKVAVHATELSTAKLALKAGADILVHSIDDPIDEEFIQTMKEKNIPLIPTLIVSGNYVKVFGQSFIPSIDDLLYANPFPLGSLFDMQHLKSAKLKPIKAWAENNKEKTRIMDSIKMVNLKMLVEHSVLIATGTDAGNIGTFHGTSYYHELEMMKKAGLTNLELLRASTINGAKVLGKENLFGSIEPGKMADLLVLNENPLVDINAIKDINYVVKGGNVLDPDDLISNTPEDLVQRQLNGYNARDIDAFLEPYSDDIKLYNFPSELWNEGKDNMRPTYESMFKNVPNLHCELVNRIVNGNTVIDFENVTGFPNGNVIEAVAIYKIKNGKIAEVYFMQ